MAGYSSGPQGGVSYSAPWYQQFVLKTNLNFTAADPDTRVKFTRVGGLQYISVTDNTTNYQWAVSATGGFNSLANGYVGYNYDPSANYTVLAEYNCTVTPLSTNTYRVTSGDARTFTLIFSPLSTVQPTISFDSGGAFATGALLRDRYYRFIFS